MSDIRQIGKLIRNIRKTKGLTQVELAERSLTTQKSISRIETGKDNASFTTVLSIFSALEVEVGLLGQDVSLTSMVNEDKEPYDSSGENEEDKKEG